MGKPVAGACGVVDGSAGAGCGDAGVDDDGGDIFCAGGLWDIGWAGGGGGGNYLLSANAAGVTVVGQAPVAVGLSQGLVAQVVATTSGTPTGTVTLDEGGVQVATARLVGGALRLPRGWRRGRIR